MNIFLHVMDQNVKAITHEHKRRPVHWGTWILHDCTHTYLYTMSQSLIMFLATPCLQVPNARKKIKLNMKTTFPFFKANFEMEKQTQRYSLQHTLTSFPESRTSLVVCRHNRTQRPSVSLCRKSGHLQCFVLRTAFQDKIGPCW